MNSDYLDRMKEEHVWFLNMSVLFGILFTVLIYKNMTSVTFPILIICVTVFSFLFLQRAGISVRKWTGLYAAGMLLLGVSTCLTANGFFHFFNAVGILLLFMDGMAYQLYDNKSWGFEEYAANFFIFIGKWMGALSCPFRHRKISGGTDRKDYMKKHKNAGAVICGILIAVLFLIVVLPLLMMSDRVFSSVFENVFGILNPLNIFEHIDIGNIVGIILTFFAGALFFYAFFAALFRNDMTRTVKSTVEKANPLTGITFGMIIAVIYILYSGIQIGFLFLRLGNLPDGMTYSQYAHEGFWQLLFVSIINFAVVLICVKVFQDNRTLRIILTVISLCTCVMILSAGYRMVLYIREYNLTFLRVLVLWFLALLMVIFGGVIFWVFRKDFPLFRYMIIVVSVCYIGLSLSRVDGIIAGYNIRNTDQINENDIYYLMYGLSADAAPEIAEIQMEILQENNMYEDVAAYFRVRKGEGEELNIRNWNFSRSDAAQAAEKWLESTEQQGSPVNNEGISGIR